MRTLRTNVIVLMAALLVGCLGSSSPTPAPPAPPPPPVAPQPPPDPFPVKVAQLDAHLEPIADTGPYTPLDDLAFLDRHADATWIGLGEATHGTKEFFELKHKIFRYLVERHGFRVFAIEADMAESVYIDRYVAGGAGDLTAIMRERMLFWTWLTAEVRELIEWIREHNGERPASERLLYVGVDCQSGRWYPDLIASYFADHRPDLSATVDHAVAPLRIPPTEMRTTYEAMTDAEYEDIDAGLGDLLDLFDAHAASLEAGSGGFEFRMHRRLAYNLRTIHATTFHWFQGRLQQSAQLREVCMAENTLWVQDLVGTDVKTAVWAHNSHVSTDELQSGGYMMGGHIRNAVGAAYRTIGFSFTRGTLTAIGPEGLTIYTHDDPPMPSSTNELLHAAAIPDYTLDMTTLPPASELAEWLRERRPFLSFGAAFGPAVNHYPQVRVGHLFDILIHIDETTASEYLGRE